MSRREHITDGKPCWCAPKAIREDGSLVWVHQQIPACANCEQAESALALEKQAREEACIRENAYRVRGEVIEAGLVKERDQALAREDEKRIKLMEFDRRLYALHERAKIAEAQSAAHQAEAEGLREAGKKAHQAMCGILFNLKAVMDSEILQRAFVKDMDDFKKALSTPPAALSGEREARILEEAKIAAHGSGPYVIGPDGDDVEAEWKRGYNAGKADACMNIKIRVDAIRAGSGKP